MKIKMDTDSVRAVAASMQNLAMDFDARFKSINMVVTSANWKSQAREQFVDNLNIVIRAGTSSADALRLMAKAADRKADQWEAISNVFNGPFYYLEGIWDRFRNALGNSWNNLLGTLGNIRWSTVTAVAAVPAAIVGSFTNLWPTWDFKKPDWWPSSEKPSSTTPQPGPMPPEKPVVENIVKTPHDTTQTSSSYPIPPIEKNLVPTTKSGSCALYAAARRPDLGSTQSSNEQYPDGAAANYIHKYKGTAFQISDTDNGNLINVIGKGYAIVWEPGHNSDKTYGHVAIIEEVHDSYVTYSHATREPPKTGPYVIKYSNISFEQLNHNQVWLIP